MGLVNLPTGMVHFYGKLVGKYTGFWDNLFAYVSEAILCEELIPDESTLDELIEWATENNLFGNLFSLAHSISSSWQTENAFSRQLLCNRPCDGGTRWLVTAPKKLGSG